MSTVAPTLDIDEAGTYAISMDRKRKLDGYHLNLGVFEAWAKAYGAKMGSDIDTNAQVSMLPITVRTHATSTGFQTGNETFNQNVQSTNEVMQFRIGRVARPVLINITEIDACGDQATLNDFVKDRFDMTRASMMREAAQHIVAGGVTAYENNVPSVGATYSLNGIDHATYGFIEHRAFGSQTNVLGGFSKATWASRPQTQNIVMDVSSSFSTNGINQMIALRTRMKKYMRNAGSWFGLITEAAINNYARALTPNQRYASEKDLNGGWMPMMLGDVPLFVEEFLPISTTYGGSTSASNKASMMIFNAKSFYPKWGKSMSVSAGGATIKIPAGRFEFEGFTRLPTQEAWASAMHSRFNLWTEGFAELGVLLNAETW